MSGCWDNVHQGAWARIPSKAIYYTGIQNGKETVKRTLLTLSVF